MDFEEAASIVKQRRDADFLKGKSLIIDNIRDISMEKLSNMRTNVIELAKMFLPGEYISGDLVEGMIRSSEELLQ